MGRANNREMAPIQHGHLDDPQPFRDCDHANISGSQRQIRIPADQLGHPRIIRRRQIDGLEVTVGE